MKALVRALCLGACLCTLNAVQAQDLATLAGTWKILFFDTPSKLTLSKDGDNDVTNVQEKDHFVTGVGDLTINANGTLSGVVEGAFTGTISVTGEGLVTANITPSDPEPGEDPPPPITFTVNAAQDVLIGVNVESSFNEVLVAVKLPGSVSEADIEGGWGFRSFETPRTLTLMGDGEGDISDIPESSQFGVYSGTVTVNLGGTLSGNVEGPFTGTYAMPGAGVLQVDVDEEPTLTFYLNASKDFMVGVAEYSSPNTQELLLMTRAPASTAVSDLAGHWRVVYMDAPPGLQLNFDGEGDLSDIPNRNNFGIAHQHLTVGSDGFLTAQFDGPKTGMLSVTDPGTIQVTINSHEGPEVVSMRLNAAKDTMTGVLNDSHSQEVIIVTKAPPQTGNKRQFGLITLPPSGGAAHIAGGAGRVAASAPSGLDIYWAAGTGRVLQSSSNLSTWTTVPETEGQHQYTIEPGSPQEFYRVAEGTED